MAVHGAGDRGRGGQHQQGRAGRQRGGPEPGGGPAAPVGPLRLGAGRAAAHRGPVEQPAQPPREAGCGRIGADQDGQRAGQFQMRGVQPTADGGRGGLHLDGDRRRCQAERVVQHHDVAAGPAQPAQGGEQLQVGRGELAARRLGAARWPPAGRAPGRERRREGAGAQPVRGIGGGGRLGPPVPGTAQGVPGGALRAAAVPGGEQEGLLQQLVVRTFVELLVARQIGRRVRCE